MSLLVPLMLLPVRLGGAEAASGPGLPLPSPAGPPGTHLWPMVSSAAMFSGASKNSFSSSSSLRSPFAGQQGSGQGDGDRPCAWAHPGPAGDRGHRRIPATAGPGTIWEQPPGCKAPQSHGGHQASLPLGDSGVRLGDRLTALRYAERSALGFPSPPATRHLAPPSRPRDETRALGVPLAEPPDPAVPAGRTVAPRKALSRWLCCLASCSSVSSRRMRWSRSCCSDFCHFLLWVWASIRKSRQACGQRPVSMVGRGAGPSPQRPAPDSR